MIGSIVHIEGNFSGRSSFKNNEKSWRNKISETPLGGMTGKGIHITDLMINLNGKIKSVLARSQKVLKKSNDISMLMLSSLILFILIPILPSGSLFSSYNGGIIFYFISSYIAILKLNEFIK